MKNHFLISDSEKNRILNLHESRKYNQGTSLLIEAEKKIGYYKVGGKKYGFENGGSNDVMIQLYIKDFGSGEMYVDVKSQGDTFQNAYEKAKNMFISNRDRIKDNPIHIEYNKKDKTNIIDNINPPTLEEL